MKQRICLWGVAISCMIILVFLFPSRLIAETCKEWVAKVVSVQGSVQARREGEAQWQTVRLNDIFCPGDMIRVKEQGRAAIALINESTLRLDQNTTVTFSQHEKGKTSLIDLLTGIVHFFSRVPRTLKVATPFVNGTVEGTEFLVRVEKDGTFLSVFEGKVVATNEAGSIMLTGGQSAEAQAGKAPTIRVVARPRDAVQWTLYYPPVFPYRPEDLAAAPRTDWRARVSFLLSVGRVDDARSEIEEALKTTPLNSDALALQSVIAVTQNEKEKALGLAKKAVKTDPNSASARIALSYAQQANFDLQGALNSLKDAVRLEPENALAWARLAEMWMSFGQLNEALKAAEKAVALNPNLARTHTVLGFAHLTQIKTKLAREEFEKAIELDQADPLPRLGLGLAKIREGNLAEGRGEIEIAASLDPDNSLIRSYLGKAYYEEKRDEKSSGQFIKAEEFDPMDPTAYFYDAIRKQSINRPVEALQDLQEAISLNDDRAVYRSKLLLDSDLAARSASLSGIYSDLGFQQLALEEAAQSVNTDPGNYSAHRFLSDSYSVLPRHEIARVSELLQSQLLQPINITPIRPEAAESQLFILEGTGPSDPSFNEFNPLFNRNRLALQTSGVIGGNSTRGDEVVASGVYNNFSMSAGQFHYETNGFRANNDLKTDIYDVFAQYSLTPNTSIQVEFRYKKQDNGDLSFNFFPDDFRPDERNTEETKSARFGFHHAFAPGSDLIGSFIYQHEETSFYDLLPSPLFGSEDIKTDLNSYGAELQHLLRLEHVKLISGIGYFKTNEEDTTDTVIFLPPLESSASTEQDIRHTNIYLYSYFDYLKNVTFTVGGSLDFFKGGIIDRDQFNPKLGIKWNLLRDTTLRATVFRTLKRTLITDQTLEPTQVAGFNQFFDDGDGTQAWIYGVGIDQKFSKNIYGGAEYYKRDLKVPFQFIYVPPPPGLPTSEVQEVDWEEHEGRAYLYWTPHPWLALSAEYLYELFNRDPQFVAGIRHVETHRFPLGIGFFHPSGFSARIKATYIKQEGEFQPQNVPPGVFESGSDDFWVVDAGISYRLPKRLGIISLTAKNLLNKSFRYQDTDFVSPSIQPKRSVFLKFTVAI